MYPSNVKRLQIGACSVAAVILGAGVAAVTSAANAPRAILNNQSLTQIVPFGSRILWASTSNEVKHAGGGQGVEISTNAGLTWTNVTPPGLSVDGGDRYISEVYALSPARAWIVYGNAGNGPQTLETTGDAGRQWSRAGVLPPTGCSLQFVSPQDGTCTVLGGAMGSMLITIYRTSNGGESWRKAFQNSPSTTSSSRGSIPFGCDKTVDFQSASQGLVLFYCNGGSGAIIYGTSNGGVTWTSRTVAQPRSVPEGGGGFTGPAEFVGPDGAIPYAVGPQSAVYVTNDGGESFHPVYPPGKPKPWAEDIVSPTEWRLTYGKEIEGTNNGGSTWFKVTSSTVLQVTNYKKGSPPGGIVEFTNHVDGWLIENRYNPNSTLLGTTDGGRTWHEIVVPGTNGA